MVPSFFCHYNLKSKLYTQKAMLVTSLICVRENETHYFHCVVKIYFAFYCCCFYFAAYWSLLIPSFLYCKIVLLQQIFFCISIVTLLFNETLINFIEHIKCCYCLYVILWLHLPYQWSITIQGVGNMKCLFKIITWNDVCFYEIIIISFQIITQNYYVHINLYMWWLNLKWVIINSF